MNKMQKIKQHVKKYQTYYIVGGAVVSAAGCGYLGYKFGSARFVENEVNSKINQVLSYKPKATIEVHVEALGDPGNIIQDITTGTIYASQNQAAKELGVSSWAVSQHLKGEIPDAGGHELVKLGKAMVSEK